MFERFRARKIGKHWGVFDACEETFCCNVDTESTAAEILAAEFNIKPEWAFSFAWSTVAEELREQKNNWRSLLTPPETEA